MKYAKTGKLNEKDFDLTGNFLPSAVLNCFQEVAVTHAEELGLGYQAMLEKNLFWVVTQIRYQVVKQPVSGQNVIVETWPLPPNRLGYERDYRISDEHGELLIKGASNWVVIDTVSRKLVMAGNLFPEENYCLDKSFDDRLRRLRDFEPEGESIRVIPDASMIDGNGHVNNTFYPAFALKALNGLPSMVKEFQIDYLHEVLCDQPLKIVSLRQPGLDFVKGLSEEGTRMFTCEFIY